MLDPLPQSSPFPTLFFKTLYVDALVSPFQAGPAITVLTTLIAMPQFPLPTLTTPSSAPMLLAVPYTTPSKTL